MLLLRVCLVGAVQWALGLGCVVVLMVWDAERKAPLWFELLLARRSACSAAGPSSLARCLLIESPPQPG